MDEARELTQRLFTEHRSLLCSFLYKHYSNGDLHLREDLFQECALRFYKYVCKHGVKSPEAEVSLLLQVCKSTCTDYKRRLKSGRKVFERLEERLSLNSLAANVENQTDLSLQINAVLDFFHDNQFRITMRVPLRLYLLEHVPVPEIAKLYQRSLPTTYRQLSHGLRTLRGYLKEKGYG